MEGIAAPQPQYVRLTGGELLWSLAVRTEGLRNVTPERYVFKKFLRLHRYADTKIVVFAKRNGVLGLCKHGLPIAHSPLLKGEVSPPYCVFRGSSSRRVEPLESWRALSREANALLALNLSISPQAGPSFSKQELDQHWQNARWLCGRQYFDAAHAEYRTLVKEGRPHSLERLRERLLRITNEWLFCGGVSIQLLPHQTSFRFGVRIDSYRGPNLFGYLAIQLAYTMAGLNSFAICSSCKHIYEPPVNTTKPETRHFCTACREAGKGVALNSKDYRARVRKAIGMHKQGYSAEEIANAIDRPIARVQGWIEDSGPLHVNAS